MSAPPSRARKLVDWVVGVTLIVLGVIGAFVPIVQGWLLVLAGLAVLSSHSRWARAFLDALRSFVRMLRARLGRHARSANLDRD